MPSRPSLSLVRDLPPLKDIRRRREAETVRQIRLALIVSAALIGLLCVAGCSAQATPPQPDPAPLPHDVLAWCHSACPRTALVTGSHDGDLFDVACDCPESLGRARVPRGTP